MLCSPPPTHVARPGTYIESNPCVSAAGDGLKAKPPELYSERRTAYAQNINTYIPACLLPNECIAFGAEFKNRHLINMEDVQRNFRDWFS